MINSFLDDYKREEAEFYADLAHIEEGAMDEETEHFMDIAEATQFEESYREIDEDEKDVNEFIERVDELEDESEIEVERILESTTPLSYDQLIGLEPIED